SRQNLKNYNFHIIYKFKIYSLNTYQGNIYIHINIDKICPSEPQQGTLHFQPREIILKLAALIRFLHSMYALMLYNITNVRETLVTLAVLLWFLTSVCSLVFYMSTLTGESLVTLAALIWFLSSVCSLV
ncbi:unnamed protein product, partial [Meganyctiphanes norvegica]